MGPACHNSCKMYFCHIVDICWQIGASLMKAKHICHWGSAFHTLQSYCRDKSSLFVAGISCEVGTWLFFFYFILFYFISSQTNRRLSSGRPPHVLHMFLLEEVKVKKYSSHHLPRALHRFLLFILFFLLLRSWNMAATYSCVWATADFMLCHSLLSEGTKHEGRIKWFTLLTSWCSNSGIFCFFFCACDSFYFSS